MNMKHIFLIGIAAVLAGCKPQTVESQSDTSVQQQVTTYTAKRQDLTGYSFFDGKLVIPDTAQAVAFSPYTTPIVSVSAIEGKKVDKGEPIVKLTIPGADAAASSAKAGVQSAEAEYAAQKEANSAPVAEAKRVLAEAQAAERAARDTIANGGEADLETATAARIQAEASLAQAQQELRRTLQPTKESIAQAAAYLRSAREDAAKGIVRAPISGTVVILAAKPGMMANANEPLATIVNFDKVRVQGLVPPELKDLVVKDSHVIIAMNGESSDPLDGIVLDVSVVPPSEGQKSPGYLTVIEFVNPERMVQPSYSVKRIGVKTGTVSNVLVVPVGAVVTKDGKSFISVKEGESWVEKPVEIGVTDGALVEIKSGINEGDQVRVTAPARTGQRI